MPPELGVLAVDIGTSELKAGVVSADGRITATERASLPLEVDPQTGQAEQDPEAWWSALAETATRAADGAKARRMAIAAVCCVGQGPTLVPLDAEGRATHHAITWMDGRPASEVPALSQATGLDGWNLGILPAARWLERTTPDAARRARWYANSWEWAIARLAGTSVQTSSPAQALLDTVRMQQARLPAGRLPRAVATGTVCGTVTATAAAALGLDPGIPVIAGTVDSFATFHGAGLVDPGDAVDTGGTSGGLAVYWDRRPSVDAWVNPAPLPGLWMAGGAMTATGRALDWLAGILGTDGAALTRLAAGVAAGADGVLFLPYLLGERSPIWNPAARGAFVGLSLAHDRSHLARAVLEAAAYALRHVATPILAAGVRIDEVRVSGGTAQSETWNQIKADVLNIPVAVPAVRETALLGAAILAATALGWYPDVATAIRSMVHINHMLEPNQAVRGTYDAGFQAYVDLWPAIAPIIRELHPE